MSAIILVSRIINLLVNSDIFKLSVRVRQLNFVDIGSIYRCILFDTLMPLSRRFSATGAKVLSLVVNYCRPWKHLIHLTLSIQSCL